MSGVNISFENVKKKIHCRKRLIQNKICTANPLGGENKDPSSKILSHTVGFEKKKIHIPSLLNKRERGRGVTIVIVCKICIEERTTSRASLFNTKLVV